MTPLTNKERKNILIKKTATFAKKNLKTLTIQIAIELEIKIPKDIKI